MLMSPIHSKSVTQDHCAYVIYNLSKLGVRKAGDMRNILIYMREKLKITPNVDLYNRTLSSFVDHKDISPIEVIVNEMKQYGIKFNRDTWCNIISGYCKAGNIDKALHCIEEAEAMNIKPNYKMYYPIYVALKHARDLDKIQSLTNEIQKKGILIHSRFIGPLISYYVNEKYFHEAESLLPLIQEEDEDSGNYCYRLLLMGYADESKLQDARRIYKILEERGDKSAFVYTSMITLYAKIGNFDLAFSFLENLQNLDGVTTDDVVRGYNIVLNSLGTHKKGDLVTNILNNMKASNIPLDHYTYGTAVAALTRTNLLIDAEQVLTQMIYAGFIPNARIFNPLLLAYGKLGDSEGFNNIAAKMKTYGIPFSIVSYTAKVLFHLSENKPLHAEETIDTMKNTSKITPDLQIYIPIIQYYCTKDDNENLFRILENIIPLVDYKLLSLLVEHFSKNQYFDLTNFLDFLRKHGIHDISAYNALFKHFLYHNDHDAFDKYFQNLLDENLKFNNFTYSYIIRRCLATNMLEEANEWGKKMIDAGHQIVGLLSDNLRIANETVGISSDYFMKVKVKNFLNK